MLPPGTLWAAGFMLCPFRAFAPSGRNLTALLPELCGLVGSLYRHVRGELVRQPRALTGAVTSPRHGRSLRYR